MDIHRSGATWIYIDAQINRKVRKRASGQVICSLMQMTNKRVPISGSDVYVLPRLTSPVIHHDPQSWLHVGHFMELAIATSWIEKNKQHQLLSQ